MIVITTPTGTIGGALARELLTAGTPLRLIARDPSRLPAALRAGAEVITGSHGDGAVLDAALPGAEALFWLVPPDVTAPDPTGRYVTMARTAAQAVRAHGVGRVVAVSSLGRGYPGPAGLLGAAWAMDAELEASGAAYRSLQPPFFMENLLHQLTPLREAGRFSLPSSPDRPIAPVATADIAATAAALLADRSWSGRQGVPVRAPEDHTPLQMAAILTEVLGREIAYEQVPLGAYRDQFAGRGASAGTADAMVEMARAQEDGVYPPATGGTGTTFRAWTEAVLRPAYEAS